MKKWKNVFRVNYNDLEQTYQDKFDEATINLEAEQDAVEAFDDIASLPEGKNNINKNVEASVGRKESHSGTMGDDFSVKYDVKGIKAQERPLQRSDR